MLERRATLGWALAGLAGAALVAVAGSQLAGRGATGWWFAPRVAPGNRAIFYFGLGMLSLGWLGIGRIRAPVGRLRVIAAAWCVPLFAGPALFSHDVYSYLAQGGILRLGLNPYHDPPAVLAHSHLLSAVSPFWRHTTAPYGPLFLGAARVIVGLTGSHLIPGVLMVRLIDLVGVALVAVFVPRLASALGADPARATWLIVLSPLVLLELIAAAHNDALMVGLLVAGVTLAVQKRPLAAIVVCALAATVKLPAAAAIVFIVVAWTRSSPNKLGPVVGGAVTAAATALAVSAVAGTGLSWISTSLISTPHKVRLAITPSTGVGYTVANLLHDLGVSVSSRHLESALAVAALALTVVVGLALALRTRTETLPRDVGLLLLTAAVCGPATWPWYLTWGVALLAAWPDAQRRWTPALTALTVVSVFVVRPDGILVLPLQSAPAVVAVYAALIAVLVVRRRPQVRRRSEIPGSVLAETR